MLPLSMEPKQGWREGDFESRLAARVSPEAPAEGVIVHVMEALSAQLIDQISCRVNMEHTFREDLRYK